MDLEYQVLVLLPAVTAYFEIVCPVVCFEHIALNNVEDETCKKSKFHDPYQYIGTHEMCSPVEIFFSIGKEHISVLHNNELTRNTIRKMPGECHHISFYRSKS